MAWLPSDVFSRDSTFEFGNEMSWDGQSDMGLDPQRTASTTVMEPSQVGPSDLGFVRTLDSDATSVTVLCSVSGSPSYALVQVSGGATATEAPALFTAVAALHQAEQVADGGPGATFTGRHPFSYSMRILFPAPAEYGAECASFFPPKCQMVRETGQQWRTITEAFARQRHEASAAWYQRVLGDAIPASSLVHDDAQWRMVLDSRTDQSWAPSISVMALRRPDGSAPLRCIRDLRQEHVPQLRRLQSDAARLIEQRFGVPQRQLVAYCEYPPQLWHFHVLFTHADHSGVSRGQAVGAGRIHLLDDICDNLEACPEHYSTRPLSMLVSSHSDAHQLVELLLAPESAEQPASSGAARAASCDESAADGYN
eukprot:TRINITY_DN32693_c0_g1_i1.p1 TRINITY_DN32693_c0_g1~~TRINITY_DN32693_c0_g1_i1.p1  ORF type:complete len:386 (+),score=85.14 TRINITY_DN32693_c0_g1_i1:55-1158(+)